MKLAVVIFVTFFSGSVLSGEIVKVAYNCKGESRVIQEWCVKAAQLIDRWYPQIYRDLGGEEAVPPVQVRLIIKDLGANYGFSVNDDIQINRQMITQHPEEFGVVIHELAHLVQAYTYPRDRESFPSWLSEGIADYFQWVRYQDKAQEWFPVNSESGGYRLGYRYAAGLLFWLENSGFPGIIRKLHQSIRDHRYQDTYFSELTGNSVDTLWENYREDMARRKSSMTFRALTLLGSSASRFAWLFQGSETQQHDDSDHQR